MKKIIMASMGIDDPSGNDYLSHLPLEIHILILQKLDYVEFSRFGAVCKSWRSIASAARQKPSFRLQQVPWLIHRISPGSKELPKLTHQKIFYELKLFHDWFCVSGPSHGWLLLNKPRTPTENSLLNPITGQRISLPRNPKFDGRPLFAGVILPHRSADEMEVVAYFDSFYHWRSQDKEWTEISCGYDTITDMIYHKGNIYAISNFNSNFCSIIITDMISNGTPYFSIRSHPSSVGNISDQMLKHLVECDGELLLVVRFYSNCITFDVSVFKYNPMEKHCWEKVRSIGEKYALFVGYSSSTAVDVSANTGSSFRANCVYFLEYDDDSGQGIRCFDLSMNRFGICMPYDWVAWTSSNVFGIPTWFMPSLT